MTRSKTSASSWTLSCRSRTTSTWLYWLYASASTGCDQFHIGHFQLTPCTPSWMYLSQVALTTATLSCTTADSRPTCTPLPDWLGLLASAEISTSRRQYETCSLASSGASAHTLQDCADRVRLCSMSGTTLRTRRPWSSSLRWSWCLTAVCRPRSCRVDAFRLTDRVASTDQRQLCRAERSSVWTERQWLILVEDSSMLAVWHCHLNVHARSSAAENFFHWALYKWTLWLINCCNGCFAASSLSWQRMKNVVKVMSPFSGDVVYMFLEWITQDISNVVHKLNMASTSQRVSHGLF